MDVSAFKTAFFDRAAVADKVPPAVRKALSKFGAFVRRRDRSSMRYAAASAAAGSPPAVHRSQGFTRRKTLKKTGAVSQQPASPLRELTYFAFDAAAKSVVVGPAAFAGRTGTGAVPRTVEEGGTALYYRDGRPHVGSYRPRPHLGPAYRAELPGAADNFKGLIA